MTAYPCISLWQPFASALFLSHPDGTRYKVHETRHWDAPKRLIGQRVMIHAAKTSAGLDCNGMVETAMFVAYGAGWRKIIPFGALLGSVILLGSQPTDDAEPASVIDRYFGDWGPGRRAWPTKDPVLLDRPIPWKGQQGWFTVDLP